MQRRVARKEKKKDWQEYAMKKKYIYTRERKREEDEGREERIYRAGAAERERRYRGFTGDSQGTGIAMFAYKIASEFNPIALQRLHYHTIRGLSLSPGRSATRSEQHRGSIHRVCVRKGQDLTGLFNCRLAICLSGDSSEDCVNRRFPVSTRQE